MCTSWCRLVLLIQLVVVVSAQVESQLANDSFDLVTVSVIFRHGDRAPFQPYPKDPYSDPKYWPMGYAQLTNTGKMQQFQLGQFLRDRYLSPKFNVSEVYVRSTDTDRTLMSAESNLAGLFPPTSDQRWNTDLSWQPIPVHTVPTRDDYLLAMMKPCEKYQRLYSTLMSDAEFVEINKKNRDLYAYMTQKSGKTIKDLTALQNVYNVLYIEDLYDMVLPNWTKSVYPEPLKKWSDFSFSVATYTGEMAQLRTGPLLNEIADRFENATKHHVTKLNMYSGHDTTIADVLNTLGLFERHSPPYAATIFFELRKRNQTHYVNILYKNSSDVQRMILKNCDFNCPLEQFLRIVAPMRMTRDEWEFACQPKFLGVMPFNTLQSSIFTGCMGLLFILLCSFVISVLCARRRRGNTVNYMRLPDEVCT